MLAVESRTPMIIFMVVDFTGAVQAEEAEHLAEHTVGDVVWRQSARRNVSRVSSQSCESPVL